MTLAIHLPSPLAFSENMYTFDLNYTADPEVYPKQVRHFNSRSSLKKYLLMYVLAIDPGSLWTC